MKTQPSSRRDLIFEDVSEVKTQTPCRRDLIFEDVSWVKTQPPSRRGCTIDQVAVAQVSSHRSTELKCDPHGYTTPLHPRCRSTLCLPLGRLLAGHVQTAEQTKLIMKCYYNFNKRNLC